MSEQSREDLISAGGPSLREVRAMSEDDDMDTAKTIEWLKQIREQENE